LKKLYFISDLLFSTMVEPTVWEKLFKTVSAAMSQLDVITDVLLLIQWYNGKHTY